MFHDFRAPLHAELDSIPIACQKYWLRQLGRIFEQRERMGNIELSNQALEQAAKEIGQYSAPDSRRPAGQRRPHGRARGQAQRSFTRTP